jgi:hypothetical protein
MLVNDKENDKSKEKLTEKIWNDSEVELLKKWGEIALCYRLLHDRAYREYQQKSYGLTIPVIILSTLSGTASFSISSFPESFQSYAPMVIGGINIIVGIIQTVTQFLRVNEYTESHRVASVTYGKFARNVSTELALPPNSRSYNGIDFVQMCRTEMDRMIEQSPIIPLNFLKKFGSTSIKAGDNVTEPEILEVSSIKIYEPSEDEKLAKMMANVAGEIQNVHKKEKTNVQKIHEKFEKKTVSTKEEDIIPDEIKDIIRNAEYKKIDTKLVENKGISIDELTKTIINNRKKELDNINNNGVVSKILKKKEYEKINKEEFGIDKDSIAININDIIEESKK